MAVWTAAVVVWGAACRAAPDSSVAPDAPPGPAPASAPAPAPAAHASATPSAVPAADGDRAVTELKAAARRRLAADRAAVANRMGFEQALERLARDARMTRMFQRIPRGVIDPAAVRQALVRHAKAQGIDLRARDVTLGASPPGQAVPLEHRGAKPYPYTEHQLLEPLPIAIRLRGADEAAAKRFYRLLPGGVEILVDLTARWRQGRDTWLGGSLYRWRDVTPPRHLVEPPTLGSLAREAGVQIPQGHPRLPEVQALLDQWAPLRPALERVLEAAGRAHLEGARAALYRHKTRAIEGRSLPPLGPRPAPPTPPPSDPGAEP